jgi:hypothetical protein
MASNNEIPDLRTLLGNRRGGGLRGRGRGRGGFGNSSEENEQIRDDAVKGTDQDAAGSRVSCVELGYLHDPYAKLFATQSATRRLPLLNRGMRPLHSTQVFPTKLPQVHMFALQQSTSWSRSSSSPTRPRGNKLYPLVLVQTHASSVSWTSIPIFV